MRNQNAAEARKERKFGCSEEDEEEAVKCTASSCRSCAAATVADSIAVCCCPFSVLNFLSLAFFKLPCAAGRRFMLRVRKMRGESESDGLRGVEDMNAEARVEVGLVEMMDAVEEERAWKELLQEGKWGFGRASDSVPDAQTPSST